jgi:cysteine-rich repeat protein
MGMRLTCSMLLVVAACASGEGARDNDLETESDGSVGSTGSADTANPGTLSTTFDPSTDGTEPVTTIATQADDDDGGGPAECGNGNVEINEDCDDGNTEDSDGCNADCTPSGSVLWEQTVGGGAMAVDEGFGVVGDDEGNFTVVGYTGSAAGPTDGWIRRYSPMGGAYWTATHAGAGLGNDHMFGVVLDDEGAAYIGGYESAADATNNAVLRKIDTFGADLWTSSFDAPGATSTIIQGVAIDADGAVIVVGYNDSMTASNEIMLRKYSPDGMPEWTRSYGGAALGSDVAHGVSAIGNGSLYVAGYESVVAEGTNMWLGKYDTDGNLLWSRSYHGAASLDDYLIGVVAGPDGEAYVCGYESSVNYPWHSFVRRYDSDGNIEWTDEFLGETGEGSHCFGIAVAPNGDVVVTGGEMNAEIRDVMVRRYTADGTVRWSRHLPGGAMGPDYGRSVSIDGDGLIYVTGAIDTGVDARDIWVARISP